MEIQPPKFHRSYYEQWGVDTVILSSHIIARPNLDGESKSQIGDDLERVLTNAIKTLPTPKPELEANQFTVSGKVYELTEDKLHVKRVDNGEVYSVADCLFVRNNELHIKNPMKAEHAKTDAYLRGASKRVQILEDEDSLLLAAEYLGIDYGDWEHNYDSVLDLIADLIDYVEEKSDKELTIA